MPTFTVSNYAMLSLFIFTKYLHNLKILSIYTGDN